VDASERARLIQRYGDGYRAVVEALDGITEEELDRSADDGWTPREIVHHLGDSEMTGATRIRLLLVQDNATIQGYDQDAFARRLMYDRPVEPSLEAMRWAREITVPVLERMTEEDWKRAGTHSERGRYTAEDWLQLQASHAHDHAAQIKKARGKTT
jgi:hypothetical protein